MPSGRAWVKQRGRLDRCQGWLPWCRVRRPRCAAPRPPLGGAVIGNQSSKAPPDAALARPLERGRADRDVPRREPVRLEDDDVVVGLPPRQRRPRRPPAARAPRASRARRRRRARSGRPTRAATARASRSRRRPRARARRCRARARADRSRRSRRRARPRCSHSPRRTGSFDVVTVTTTSCAAGVAVALAGLGAGALAEGREPLGGAAVGDDPLERRHRRADRRDLALGLPAAADHAERSSRPRARGASRRRRSRRRCEAGRAGRPRSRPRACLWRARTGRRRRRASRPRACSS